jgi:hypothetical protein
LSILTNLASHWKFDEHGASGQDAVDIVAAKTLTQMNGVAASTGLKMGGRRLNAGVGNYFVRANDAHFDVSNTTWGYGIHFRMTSKASTGHIVCKRESGQLENWIRYDAGADRFEFRVYATPNGSQTTIVANTFGSPSVEVDYYLIAWVDIALQTINIGVNDQYDSASFAGVTADGASGFEVGAGAGNEWADGWVGDLSFWKGGFPTEAERTVLSNGIAFENFGLDLSGGGGSGVSRSRLVNAGAG